MSLTYHNNKMSALCTGEEREVAVDEEWRYGGGGMMKGDRRIGIGVYTCECKMHAKAQVGVPAGLGCACKPIGEHPAIQAIYLGKWRDCKVLDDVKEKDDRFWRIVASVKQFGLVAYADSGAYKNLAKKYATGVSNFEDFGRGYCYLLGVKEGFHSRVARVFGPNMYVADLLKVLCVAGKNTMVELEVQEIAEGFLHLEKKENGVVFVDAGKELYKKLVEYVKEYPEARVGASLDFSQHYSGAVSGLRFGDVPVARAATVESEKDFSASGGRSAIEWNNALGNDILGLVKWHQGEDVARKLALTMGVVPIGERKRVKGHGKKKNQGVKKHVKETQGVSANMGLEKRNQGKVFELRQELVLPVVGDVETVGKVKLSWADELIELCDAELSGCVAGINWDEGVSTGEVSSGLGSW